LTQRAVLRWASLARSHVTQLRIRGFGCIRDASFALTPIHAIIGPSDSGKTTVLRALRALAKYAQARNVQATQAEFNLYGRETTTLEAHVEGAGGAIVHRDRAGWGEHHVDDEARAALGGQLTLRLEPEALRQASSLIPEGAPLRFADERGLGLPAVYDVIMSRDVGSYLALGERMTKLFPSVKTIGLKNPSQQTKALGVRLHDGSFVAATSMSEGLLYWLAFAAVPFLAPAGLLLVEEPENGLHPALLRDVMGMLRDISREMQVVIATHSPIVVDELERNEVTVLRRDEREGTKATLLSELKLEGPDQRALGG